MAYTGSHQEKNPHSRRCDSDQVCSVAEWHWMDNAPCERNPDTGECDVADA
jgi:hypothetical protein